jgi:hypothetical protein
MSTKAEQEEAVADLKRVLKRGDTVYCILAKAAPSGMSREIKLYKINKSGEQWLSYWVSKALSMRMGKHEGVIVGGAGMDMGFAIVDHLSHKLFGKGGQLKHRWL